MSKTIPVVFGLDANVKGNIQYINVEDIENVLESHDDVYEITWSESDNQKCRAYLDIDGMMDNDTDMCDFDVMDDAIKTILINADLKTPFTVMTASKYKNKDWKDKSLKHKLSYRITFTNKCGTKENVKNWCRDIICPILKNSLQNTIAFYVKGKDIIPEDATDYLDWDNGVYRTIGKMRCWNSTKPNEKRLNKIIKGKLIDTLINYIPDECDVLISTSTPIVTSIATPIIPTPIILTNNIHINKLTPEKQLIVKVMIALPVTVANTYNEWLSVGMACFNEDIPMIEWEKWSKTSQKYKENDCQIKWNSFKKGNITQSYIWSLLKKHDMMTFKSLLPERKDFIKLIDNPTHYSVAEYFYNNRQNDYLFDTNSGWFGITNNNVWENPKSKVYPPTLKNKIVRVLNTERLQLEKTILEQKLHASELDENTERLDKLTKKCIEFKDKIENDTFQKGMINFLSSFYAEQSQILLLSKGIKSSDGVISVFDINPNLFAFTDCLYDFTINKFRSIEPIDYITITCGYERPHSNPEIRKQVMKTLNGIWECEKTCEYMLKLLSSCLNGTRNMEVFTILTGRGGNGKGLLWVLVEQVFGGYYINLPVASLTKKVESSTCATPDIASLRGMRCVGTSEPEQDEKLQEGTVKLHTGGDLLTGRPLYGQPFTFKPQYALFIQCNTIPVFNQITKGGVRRNRVIPFPFSFVGEPKLSYERKGDPLIKNVSCRSEEWRNEFFHILLELYVTIHGKQIDQIDTPNCVTERTNEYVEDNNRVGVWWTNTYEICEDNQILSRDALEEYKSYSHARLSDREFKSSLSFNDIDICKITKGINKDRMGILNWKKIEVKEITEVTEKTKCFF